MKACIHDHEICIIVIAQHIHTYKYDIQASEAANAYLFLKANFDENSIL